MMLENLFGRVISCDPEDAPGLIGRGFRRPVLVRKHPEGAPGTFLVARPYGGLGDMICLRPAVLQLPREMTTLLIEDKYRCLFPEMQAIPYPYHLAVAKHRYSLGSGSDFFLSFENGFTELSYETVYDCWCPAGDHEFDSGYRPTKHRVQIFAEHLGVETRQPDMTPVVDDDTGYWWWREHGGCKDNEVIGLQVATMHPSKDWPLDRWHALAETLENLGHTVVVFCETEVKLTPNAVSCYGLDLPGLGSVIGSLSAMVATDSGLMHYALALGIPTLGLFGPTDGALTMQAYPDTPSAVIQGPADDLPCHAPCYYSRPDNGYYCEASKNLPRAGDCMKRIAVGQVAEALTQLL